MATPPVYTQGNTSLQGIKEEGRGQGRQQEAANLVIRLLTKRFGELFQEMRSHISSLPLPVLEDLREALLDFTSIADVQAWLEA